MIGGATGSSSTSTVAARTVRKVLRAGLMVAALLAFLEPTPAHAGVGRLDPAFGRDGLTTTPPGTAGVEAAQVELDIAPGGGPVVGHFGEGASFIRFRTDGSRDQAFGEHGRVFLGPGTAGQGSRWRYFRAGAMAIDGRGRLLVFGTQDGRREVPCGCSSGFSVPESAAVVLRLGRTGRLDPSFGAGKGFVRDDFGLGSGLETEAPMVAAMTGRVDPQDRPVLVAGVTTETTGCVAHSGPATRPRAVVRLTAAGLPDPTFGEGDGVSPIEGTTGSPGLGLDGEGAPVVAVGRIDGPHPECEPGTAVLRLGAQGERVPGFGAEGVATFEDLHLSFVEPSGGVVLSHRKGRTLSVMETNADGGPEATFGSGGVARVRLPFDARLHVEPVAVDGRGRILLAGFVGSPVGSPAKGGRHPSAFVVARLAPGGGIDRGFGHKGWIFTRLPGGLEATSAKAALDHDGRLLVAGTVDRPPARDGGFAIARYLLGR